MNSVERVKMLCRERKIPISRLERELGYANGYFGQLRKGVLPDDRLVEIAAYFNVSTDYLLTGETKSASDPKAGRTDELSEIEFALWGELRELDDEDKAELLRDAKRMRELKDLREKHQG